MANNAHLVITGGQPQLTIRDDRGAPVQELILASSAIEPEQADQHLHAAGWSRSASTEWTKTDDGWVVPVTPS